MKMKFMIENHIWQTHVNPSFDLGDTQFSLSVISSLYNMAGERRIPINVVNDFVKIPDYIAKDNDAMYSIHVYDKSKAYFDLKMYNDMLFESNEAIKIKINLNEVDALLNKGTALAKLGRYQEAIEWYDKALEILSKYVLALNNKGQTLDLLGR